MKILLKKVAAWLGVTVSRRLVLTEAQVISRTGLNLNVGAGGRQIDSFVNLDIDSDHYYGSSHFRGVTYDMRRDRLPFDNGVVSNIYVSHVIEHVERQFAVGFFHEAVRVLKPGGCLRVVVPDASFLFEMFTKSSSYFAWHKKFKEQDDAWLVLADELGAHHQDDTTHSEQPELATEMTYDMLLEFFDEGQFSYTNPARHITNWDFERLEDALLSAGFSLVIRSRCKGASAAAMQGTDFDNTHPEMSLYVDAWK